MSGAQRGTPIRDYDPDLDAGDYAALARIRDEIRGTTARTTTARTATGRSTSSNDGKEMP